MHEKLRERYQAADAGGGHRGTRVLSQPAQGKQDMASRPCRSGRRLCHMPSAGGRRGQGPCLKSLDLLWKQVGDNIGALLQRPSGGEARTPHLALIPCWWGRKWGSHGGQEGGRVWESWARSSHVTQHFHSEV